MMMLYIWFFFCFKLWQYLCFLSKFHIFWLNIMRLELVFTAFEATIKIILLHTYQIGLSEKKIMFI